MVSACNNPERDKILSILRIHEVLSKIIFYLLEDGCIIILKLQLELHLPEVLQRSSVEPPMGVSKNQGPKKRTAFL